MLPQSAPADSEQRGAPVVRFQPGRLHCIFSAQHISVGDLARLAGLQ
jgi:hypothetical protein